MSLYRLLLNKSEFQIEAKSDRWLLALNRKENYENIIPSEIHVLDCIGRDYEYINDKYFIQVKTWKKSQVGRSMYDCGDRLVLIDYDHESAKIIYLDKNRQIFTWKGVRDLEHYGKIEHKYVKKISDYKCCPRYLKTFLRSLPKYLISDLIKNNKLTEDELKILC